jgi:hypothetical protein
MIVRLSRPGSAAVRLLAFPPSSAGKAMLAEDILNFLRADQGLLGELARGTFSSLDANVFAERNFSYIADGPSTSSRTGCRFTACCSRFTKGG